MLLLLEIVMSKYAVIQIAGKQYRVNEGDRIVTNKVEGEVESTLKADVLLIADEKSSQVGEPLLSGVNVTLKVVDHHQGDKIRVAKYKSKSRYRRVRGHRQQQTTFEVVAIG